MEGTTEDKSFAPGYGEFYTAGGGDVEALALAVPTDAASGPTPAELQTLSSGALDVFDAAGPETGTRPRPLSRRSRGVEDVQGLAKCRR